MRGRPVEFAFALSHPGSVEKEESSRSLQARSRPLQDLGVDTWYRKRVETGAHAFWRKCRMTTRT